jgi:hypothetical protein
LRQTVFPTQGLGFFGPPRSFQHQRQVEGRQVAAAALDRACLVGPLTNLQAAAPRPFGLAQQLQS